MKILLVHNRYRSTAPSGENRVVDQELAALAAAGQDVELFERRSDEIEDWPAWKKATLPARVVWNPAAKRDLGETLQRFRPDVVHVHNTFPVLSPSVLYACRDAGVPVVISLHNYKLLCASGDFFRDGAVCHDCAGGNPLPGVRHRCYRGSTLATASTVLNTRSHRRSWRDLVSAFVFISESQRRSLAGLRFDPDRSFVRYNYVPYDGPVGRPGDGRKQRQVAYVGRLDAAKGAPLLMKGWDAYRAIAGDDALRLVIAGGGPMLDEVTAWAASRPSVELRGLLSKPEVFELLGESRGSSCRRSGRRRSGWSWSRRWRSAYRRWRPPTVPSPSSSPTGSTARCSIPAAPTTWGSSCSMSTPTPTGTTSSAATRGRRTRPSTTPDTPSGNCSTSTGSPSTSQPHRFISPQHVPPEGRAMEQRDPSPPVSGRGTAWYRNRRTVIVAGVAVLAVVAGAGVYVANRPSSTGATSSGPAATSTAANVVAPKTPPARICGNVKALSGPATAPAGAVVVSATQNLHDVTEASPAGTTFYLEAGKHTLGSGAFSQVIPKQGNVYIGAPGAVLDGGRKNRYAFTGYATDVTIKYLTIQNFGARRTNNNEGVVNHDAAAKWTMEANTIREQRRRRA